MTPVEREIKGRIVNRFYKKVAVAQHVIIEN